jgi:spermidine synthase
MFVNMFVPIGRLLGRLLDEHPNTIQAYSVNIAGSLAGTWLFVLLSYFYQPPLTWFLVLAALTLFFLDWSGRAWRLNLALLVGIVALSWFAGLVPGSREVVWSPYQKLVLWDMDLGKGVMEYHVSVNNVGYQAMLSAREPLSRPAPEDYPPEMKGQTQYDIPFLLHPDPESALVVGAGSGNDVAGALRHGLKSVVAVDIDPAIISFGRRYHPDRPYASPNVQLINDDARSYFATCQRKFDVISFGLLDSHTATAMTNAPLDHYVYTCESITRAKSLLADGGVMTLCFEAHKPFIADRMAGVLRKVFGADPMCFRIPRSHYGYGGVMFVAGDLESVRTQITKNPRLASLIAEFQKDDPVNLSYKTQITTDDWPYIFLKTPNIPPLYYFMVAMTAILVIRGFRTLGSGWRACWPGRNSWHFFFLGAAFLLLEVQNISKASVVLGNTWEVNAVIVSGVLLMIMAANYLAYRFPDIHTGPVYAALFAICLGLYFVDLARFAFLPYAAKAAIVGGLTTMPMLFSGIVFIRSFTRVTGKDMALGANLVGALFGAMLQSATFIIGIKALLIVVLTFYMLAMVTRPHAATYENKVADQG